MCLSLSLPLSLSLSVCPPLSFPSPFLITPPMPFLPPLLSLRFPLSVPLPLLPLLHPLSPGCLRWISSFRLQSCIKNLVHGQKARLEASGPSVNELSVRELPQNESDSIVWTRRGTPCRESSCTVGQGEERAQRVVRRQWPRGYFSSMRAKSSCTYCHLFNIVVMRIL